jgi:ParB family transcriptional regulator, chromosome partitioning protein
LRARDLAAVLRLPPVRFAAVFRPPRFLPAVFRFAVRFFPVFRAEDFRALDFAAPAFFFAVFRRGLDRAFGGVLSGLLPGTTARTARRPASATAPAAVVTTLPTVLAAVPTPDVTVSKTPSLLESAIVPPESSAMLLQIHQSCVRQREVNTATPTVYHRGVGAQDEVPRAVAALLARITADGGQALATYREPIGDHWQIFCLLPLDKVAPTPYQRDLSPAHVKRLHEAVKKIDRFVDPIVLVSPEPGVYWTPNGHHRLKVLQKMKAATCPAILIPEPEVAFQILALNTEKAHNLKEKSLEVIRMYRALAEVEPRRGEEDYSFQFEAAHLITLGLLYETNKRFAGGAFAPLMRRVDGFLSGTFGKTRREREARAEKVRDVDTALAGVVAQIHKRGIRHPFVKNYVLARTTPLGRARKTLPTFDKAFETLLANIEAFDVDAVRYQDVQRAGVMAIPASE